METKICTKCGKELPITDYNWRDKAKGTRRSECKYCHSKYMKAKYQEKKETVSQIKEQCKCAKCGESRPYCLDFHHKDPSQKDNTIARLTSNTYALSAVFAEIEKCEVLCSNCHREFHYLEERDGITLEQYLAK